MWNYEICDTAHTHHISILLRPFFGILWLKQTYNHSHAVSTTLTAVSAGETKCIFENCISLWFILWQRVETTFCYQFRDEFNAKLLFVLLIFCLTSAHTKSQPYCIFESYPMRILSVILIQRLPESTWAVWAELGMTQQASCRTWIRF